MKIDDKTKNNGDDDEDDENDNNWKDERYGILPYMKT